ncbi:hypothetical protein BZA77DRAFT_114676 [Pyronema omphalodes]|nr:hypothetical protein BZA77DRAFT_114676 [Pyronema omphalodes]
MEGVTLYTVVLPSAPPKTPNKTSLPMSSSGERPVRSPSPPESPKRLRRIRGSVSGASTSSSVDEDLSVGCGGAGAGAAAAGTAQNVSPPRNGSGSGSGYGPGSQLHHPRHLKSSPKSAYLREGGGGSQGHITDGNQRNYGDQTLPAITYAKRVIDFDGVRLQQSPVSFDEGVPVSDPSTKSTSTQFPNSSAMPFANRKIGFGGDRYEPPSPPSSRDSVAITDTDDDDDDEEDKEHGGALLEAASAYSLAINGQQHGKGKDRVVAKSGKRVTPWVSRASSFCSERPDSVIEDDEDDEEEEDEEEEGMTTASTTPNPLKQRKLLASPMLDYGNSGNGSESGRRNLLDVGQRYKYANGNFGHDSRNGGGASLPVCDPVPAPTDSPAQIIRRMSEETADIFVDAVSTPPPATPAPASPETTFNGNHSIINSLDMPKIQTPPSLLSTPQKSGESRGTNGARQFSNASNTTDESHESNTTDETSTTNSTTPRNQHDQQMQQTPNTHPHTKPRLTPSDMAATRIVQVTQPTIPASILPTHPSTMSNDPQLNPSIPTISEPTSTVPPLPALNLIPATPLALSTKEEAGKQLGFARPSSRRSTGSGSGGFTAVDEEYITTGGDNPHPPSSSSIPPTAIPPTTTKTATTTAKVEVDGDGDTNKPKRPKLSEIPQRVRESKLHPWWMPKAKAKLQEEEEDNNNNNNTSSSGTDDVTAAVTTPEELGRRATVTGGVGTEDNRKKKGKRINVKGTRFVIEFVGWKRFRDVFWKKKGGKDKDKEKEKEKEQGGGRRGLKTRMTV